MAALKKLKARSMADISTHEAPLFPATYRESKTRIVAYTSIISIVCLMKIISLPHARFSFILLFFIVAVFVVVGLSSRDRFGTEIILYSDRIEIRRGRKTRVISLDQIYSIKRVGLGRLRIYCKALQGPDVYIPSGIGGDAAWNTWMARVNGGDKLMKKSRPAS